MIGKGRVERHGRFRTLHSAQDDLISEETHAAGAYRRHDGNGYCSSRGGNGNGHGGGCYALVFVSVFDVIATRERMAACMVGVRYLFS